MNKNLSPFVLAPIALLLAMQGVQAMTLGELQLKSYIGQRFKADIPYHLNPEEQLNEDCNQIRPSAADVAYLGPATLQLIPRGDGRSGVIRVTSLRSTEEPLVGFALNVTCENIDLTRDYTIFLDPAPAIDVPLVAEKTAKPIKVTSIEGQKTRQVSAIQQDTSLAKIAQRYYSPTSSQYARYLQQLQRSNPDFAPDDMIVAGSAITIPPRPKPKPKVQAPSVAQVDTATLAPSHLRLEGDERASAPPLATKANSAAYIKELESKVAELSELRQKLQMEIDALDVRLAQNTGESSASVAQANNQLTSPPIDAVAASVAAPVLQASSVAAVASAGPAVRRSKDAGMDWQWAIIGLLGLVGASVWWWSQHRRRNDGDDFDSRISEGGMSVLKTNFAPRYAAATQLSFMQQGNSAIEVSDDDSTSLEQAQYFLARGDTLRAIELLQQLLEADPLDVERWLMLFRVYRQQGMKSDYVQLAYQFRAQMPKPAEEDWELVRSIGYKLIPEHELFARVEKSTPAASPALVIEDTPVDLAIENLTMSSQALSPVSVATDKGAINLIDVFQPPPKSPHPFSPRLDVAKPEGNSITVPELSLMNHQMDLSTLDQFEFDAKEIEFDDVKDHSKPA